MGILKKTHLVALIACTGLMACSSSEKGEQKKQEHNKQEQNQSKSDAQLSEKELGDIDVSKLSEALGHFIGRNIKSPGVQFNLDKIIAGMREGAAGKPSPMTDEEYETTMAKLQQKVYEHLSETNLAAANKFLNENAHAEGVVEIVPEKLQYLILQEGNGPEVPEHGTPSINYTGKYIDGTVFGSSENSGGPISVPIDQTIQGFSKGIAGMKEGEKRRLFVHPDFGYGKGGQLPPNTLLIFDIEVVKTAPSDQDATHDQADAEESEERDGEDTLENDQDVEQQSKSGV